MSDVSIAGVSYTHSRGVLNPVGKRVTPAAKGGGGGGGVRVQTLGVGGTLETWSYLADETAAHDLAADAGRLQDTYVAVVHAGYDLGNAYLERVTARVRKVRGAPSGTPWRVDLSWQFNEKKQQLSGGGGGQVDDLFAHVKVYTGWQVSSLALQEDLRCREDVDALAPKSLGSASLIQNVDATHPPLDIVGRYVRLDAPNDVESPTSWTPYWLGRVVGRDLVPNPDGGDEAEYAVFNCHQSPIFLAGFLPEWHEAKRDESAVVDAGWWLPVNGIPNGDRSSAKIGGFYYHNRNVPGLPWRPQQWLPTVFFELINPWVSDFDFTLGGQTACLGNHDIIRPNTGTVLEALAQICAAGIAWRQTGTGVAQVLEFVSPLQAELSVANYTIPANTKQISVDFRKVAAEIIQGTDRHFVDQSLVADTIYVLARAQHVISLGYEDGSTSGQLAKGWDASLQGPWSAAPWDEKADETYNQLYRRFVLMDDWTGGSYKQPTEELHCHRDLATDATHGTNGEDGEFSAGGSFSLANVRLLKHLPLNAGKDYSGPTAADPYDATLQAQAPMAFRVVDPSGTPKWYPLDMPVTIDTGYPAILIGDGPEDKETISDILTAGDHIVVTVGYTFPLPWRMSWNRSAADRPGRTRRMVHYQFDDLQYEYIHEDTVLGVTNNVPTLNDAGVVGGNKPEGLVERLALARVIHQDPRLRVSWQAEGIDLAAAKAPGALVTQVTSRSGNVTQGAALLISRGHLWEKIDPRTVYHAETRHPGTQSVVEHLSVPFNDWQDFVRYEGAVR